MAITELIVFPLRVATIFCMASALLACHGSNEDRMSAHVLQIANNHDNSGIREEQARSLSKPDQKSLCSLLMQRIPGGWDYRALDDIAILGEIGDETIAVRLEQLSNAPPDNSKPQSATAAGGRIRGAMGVAAQNIRLRLAKIANNDRP